MSGADLEGADLEEADLCGAVLLGGTNLKSANLKNANVNGADIYIDAIMQAKNPPISRLVRWYGLVRRLILGPPALP